VREVINPNNLNAGQIATTPAAVTTKPTKRPVTPAAGEQDSVDQCGMKF